MWLPDDTELAPIVNSLAIQIIYVVQHTTETHWIWCDPVDAGREKNPNLDEGSALQGPHSNRTGPDTLHLSSRPCPSHLHPTGNIALVLSENTTNAFYRKVLIVATVRKISQNLNLDRSSGCLQGT